jgi:hypothetical protein
MTLVAGLSVGGLPAFIGDLLISWRLPNAIDLPTSWAEGVHPGLGENHAAGLAQKLIIVRPYLMLAWAGVREDVDRMARELDSVLPKYASELNDPDLILKILDTCGSSTELVALVVVAKEIHPICANTRGFEIDNKRIYLLGSGASEFFEYLQTHPEVLPGQEREGGQLAQAIMLRFAARAMMLQLIVKTGFQDSWGGGFEVAYPGEGGFRKIDNLMFRAWMIDDDGEYHNSGRSFFLRYYGQDLHLSWFNPSERTYIIRSPIGKPIDIPKYEEANPEWMLDVFVVKKNGSFVEFARYQPPNRPVKDQIELMNGSLVGWSMDQGYVERCAKTALLASESGSHFEMIRY